jgi:PTS system ascorbate-specific IIC component
MDVVGDVLQFVANNLFRQVALLIGLVTLIGQAVQRKPVEEVLASALRATIGVVVLLIGVQVFIGGLQSFQAVMASAAGLQPPKSANTLNGFLNAHGGSVALVLAVGFLLHLVLVRILRTRYVYLTGHLLFWMSVVVVAVLVEVSRSASQLEIVIVGSIVTATYWTLQPLLIAPFMRKVIGSDDFGYAHTSASAAIAAGAAGRYVGSPERHGTESIKLPRRLSFFRDVNVSTVLIITLILLVAMAFADRGVLAEQVRLAAEGGPGAAPYAEGVSNPWVWGLIAGLRFAAGIAILLFGVRMFLAELVPAFKGISDKIIPDSRPAVDVPAVFPFAPTAVMIGFLSGTAVFLVCMVVFAAAGWFVLVPPMIMLFFPGAGAAVFGNAFGGWRGAVLGGVINGLALAIGQAVTWGMLGNTAPELATLADPDWYLMAWLMRGVGATGGSAALWIIAGVYIVLFAAGYLLMRRVARRRVAAGGTRT